MPADGDEVRATPDEPTGAGELTSASETPDGADAGHGGPPAASGPRTIAEQMTAAADARRLLWPWVARRTLPQIVALVLISCLALGPAFALVTILQADPTPVDTVLTVPPTGTDVSRVTVTAIRLSPIAGEMQTRIAFSPAPDLVDETGKLRQPVSVTVNSTQGTNVRTFETGEMPTAFDVTMSLTEGTTNRYPFDRYRGSTVVVVTTDPDEAPETRPSVIEAKSVVGDFDLSGTSPTALDPTGGPIGAVNWTATRPATTTVYAVWLMILMWGLAVIGLLIVWGVVIWMIDLPFWAVGYLVGVLFALPPLRDSLPGRPPPGTIFDFVSFYWSVTIIGVNLILLLAVWLRRVRSESRLRSLDTHQEA